MTPVNYPDFGWSGRFSRLMRTLQVVAIAGTVGAVGGGVGVLAVMGLPGGSPHPQRATSNKAHSPAVGHATSTAQSASPAQPKSSVPPQSAPPQSNLAVAAQPQPAAQPQTTNDSPRANTVAVGATSPASPPTSPPKASQAPAAQQQFATRERVAPEHDPAANAAQADQRSHAAQDEHAVTRNLYDRAVPTASDEGSANQSASSRSTAARKRAVKRVNRPAVAALPQAQYAPDQRDQYAPDVPPPMAIVPGRGYQGGWRAENADSGDSRSGPYYARDAWRNRRPDDYDRDRGPANPIAGFFGFLGGGDWH
jgi:hypothetical protein